MLELAAEYDDELMEKFVHDKSVDVPIIKRAVRKGTIACKLQPVFVGSALQYIGIQKLLDGVVDYLPSPLEKPEITGHKPDNKDKMVSIKCDRKLPLVALVFKVATDSHGDLDYIRIYQGTLKSGSRVIVANRSVKENITRLFEMHADERIALESAAQAILLRLWGSNEALTGDTICDTRHPVCLPSITFPQTVISMSIEPKTGADRMKLSDALAALQEGRPHIWM